MPALRCSICAHNWPTQKDYAFCPECEQKCDYIGNVTAMPEDEAKSLKLHAEFERFYAERESASA